MTPERLKRRYRSLWTGEAVSICAFTALLVWRAVSDGDWTAWILRTYSIGLLNFILLQGVGWWRWKLRLLEEGRQVERGLTLRLYRLLKQVNWVLIALFPIGVVWKWYVMGDAGYSADLWLGALFLLGAVLEQINYYYYQLMYDTRYDWRYLKTQRRLRPGNIALALRKR